jgi:hypothetical protein
MRSLPLIAATAAMAFAMPVLAKPGQGQGGGHSGGHPAGHGASGTVVSGGHVDNRAAGRYGANACPPGLAAKNNGCLPPGQARKLYNVGQRLPTGYNRYTPYGEIPVSYRDRYGLASDGRYIYRDQNIYVVDPRTHLVTRIIDLVR